MHEVRGKLREEKVGKRIVLVLLERVVHDGYLATASVDERNPIAEQL